jgi:hypothetical protein
MLDAGVSPWGVSTVSRFRLPLLGLCSLWLLAPAGCSHGVTRPATTNVQLAVSIIPQPADTAYSLRLNANVANAGSTPVWHCQGCGCGTGIGITVLGPDGKPVDVLDPKRPMPLCPDGLTGLDPGANLETWLTFTGRLYVADSPIFPTPTYQAPPGTYTVVGDFAYNTVEQWPSSGSGSVIERRARFIWPPSAP